MSAYFQPFSLGYDSVHSPRSPPSRDAASGGGSGLSFEIRGEQWVGCLPCPVCEDVWLIDVLSPEAPLALGGEPGVHSQLL